MARLVFGIAASLSLTACGARTGDFGFIDEGDASVAPHDSAIAIDASSPCVSSKPCLDAGADCPPSEPVAFTKCTLDVMKVCNWSNGCGAFDTGWCEGGRWSLVKPGCSTGVDAGGDSKSCAPGAPCTGAETCRPGCWRSCTCEAGMFVCVEHPC